MMSHRRMSTSPAAPVPTVPPSGAAENEGNAIVSYSDQQLLELARKASQENRKMGQLWRRKQAYAPSSALTPSVALTTTADERQLWRPKWFVLYQNLLFIYASEREAITPPHMTSSQQKNRPLAVWLLEGVVCEKLLIQHHLAGSLLDGHDEAMVPPFIKNAFAVMFPAPAGQDTSSTIMVLASATEDECEQWMVALRDCGYWQLYNNFQCFKERFDMAAHVLETERIAKWNYVVQLDEAHEEIKRLRWALADLRSQIRKAVRAKAASKQAAKTAKTARTKVPNDQAGSERDSEASASSDHELSYLASANVVDLMSLSMHSGDEKVATSSCDELNEDFDEELLGADGDDSMITSSQAAQNSSQGDEQLRKIKKAQSLMRGWLARHKWKQIVDEYIKSPHAEKMRQRNRIIFRLVKEEKEYVDNLTVLVSAYLRPLRMAASSCCGANATTTSPQTTLPTPTTASKKLVKQNSKAEASVNAAVAADVGKTALTPEAPPGHHHQFVVSHEEVNAIFLNCQTLLFLHQIFLAGLSSALDRWPQLLIGDIFQLLLPALSVYTEYVRNHYVSVQTLAELKMTRPALARMIRQIELKQETLGDSRSLETLLTCPMNQIPRYILNFHELLAYTMHSHIDRPKLEAALQSLEDLSLQMSTEMSESEHIRKNLSIERMIGDGGQVLLDPDEVLVRQGALLEMEAQGETGAGTIAVPAIQPSSSTSFSSFSARFNQLLHGGSSSHGPATASSTAGSNKLISEISRNLAPSASRTMLPRTVFLFSHYLIITTRSAQGKLSLVRHHGIIPLNQCMLIENLPAIASSSRHQSLIPDLDQHVQSVLSHHHHNQQHSRSSSISSSISSRVGMPSSPMMMMASSTSSSLMDDHSSNEFSIVADYKGDGQCIVITFAASNWREKQLWCSDIMQCLEKIRFDEIIIETRRYFNDTVPTTGAKESSAPTTAVPASATPTKQRKSVVNAASVLLAAGKLAKKSKKWNNQNNQEEKENETEEPDELIVSSAGRAGGRPIVKQASLDALLRCLTDFRLQTGDFINVFLTTYRLFTSGDRVLSELSEAYRHWKSFGEQAHDELQSIAPPMSLTNSPNLFARHNRYRMSTPMRFHRPSSSATTDLMASSPGSSSSTRQSNPTVRTSGRNSATPTPRLTSGRPSCPLAAADTISLSSNSNRFLQQINDSEREDGGSSADEASRPIEPSLTLSSIASNVRNSSSILSKSVNSNNSNATIVAGLPPSSKEAGRRRATSSSTTSSSIFGFSISAPTRSSIQQALFGNPGSRRLSNLFSTSPQPPVAAAPLAPSQQPPVASSDQQGAPGAATDSEEEEAANVMIEAAGSQRSSLAKQVNPGLIVFSVANQRRRISSALATQAFAKATAGALDLEVGRLQKEQEKQIRADQMLHSAQCLNIFNIIRHWSIVYPEDFVVVPGSSVGHSNCIGEAVCSLLGEMACDNVNFSQQEAAAICKLLRQLANPASSQPQPPVVSSNDVMKTWLMAKLAQLILGHQQTNDQQSDGVNLLNMMAPPSTPMLKQAQAASQVFDEKTPAIDIAEQMTYIDFSLFKSIKLSELMNQAWSKSATRERDAPTITMITAHFNHMSSLVVTNIVSQSTAQDRAQAIKKWLLIASTCFGMHNYNGAMQIISALQSSPVYRLKKSWEKLAKQSKQSFDKLAAQLSAESRFKQLRELIKSSDVPACPYLGMYLQDLTLVEEGCPTFVSNYLVNFSKMKMIYQIISEIQSFQSVVYKIAPKQQIIEQLLDRSLALDDDTVYRLSLAVEPRQTGPK